MRVNTSAVCYLLNLFKRVDHPNKRKSAKASGWRLVLVTKKLDLEINKGDKNMPIYGQTTVASVPCTTLGGWEREMGLC